MYLNNLPPALATIHTGLAAFGFLVIVRFCIQRVRSWSCSVEPSHSFPLSGEHQSRWHHQSQPPAPTYTGYPSEKQSIGVSPSNMKNLPGSVSSTMESSTDAKSPTTQHGNSGLRRQLNNHGIPAIPGLTSTGLDSSERRINVDDFMKQPNPNYSSAVPPSSVDDASSEATGVSPSAPRRRSYIKTLTVGIPTDAPVQQGVDANNETPARPNSYPASPQPAPVSPSASGAQTEPTTPTDQAQGIWPSSKKSRHNIDVRGEIISLVDSKGISWTRHTRVYGGGVCFACAASGGGHGKGGFYGPNVPPEEMCS